MTDLLRTAVVFIVSGLDGSVILRLIVIHIWGIDISEVIYLILPQVRHFLVNICDIVINISSICLLNVNCFGAVFVGGG